MRKNVFLTFLLILSLSSNHAAFAMGSGDKYIDLQTGVTFQIFKPTTTLGLPNLNFEVRPCKLFPKKEEYLLAGFGSVDQGIALVETAAAFNCTGKDNPRFLKIIRINGIKAKVGIYCPTKCSAKSFKEYGGEITFTVPKNALKAATYIRVGTQGGFTLKQLTAFAKGLKPVEIM